MSLRGNDRVVIEDGGKGSTTGASRTNTANWKTKSEPAVPEPSTQSYVERAKELNAMPVWTPEQKNEAKAVSKALESGSARREIYASPEKAREYSDASNKLYVRVHPATTGFAANLYQGMGIGSLTEAFGNGLGRVTENQKIADTGQQIARTIDETAAYGRQKAPRASAAGGLAGNLALYGGLAQGVGAIPGLANLSPLARSVGTGALTLVGGTAVQEVGEASTTGDWERFARDTGISTLAGGVGGAAAYGANVLGRGALSDLGLQDSKLLNIANRSWSAGMFGLAAGDTRETARALTGEGYEPDWNGVARDAKALALLGAVDGLLDSAAISQREKARTQENIKDVQEWYKAARDTLVDPNATPEQRSILAQRAINHADWARLQLDEIRSPGAQREIGEAQRALDGISKELKPWAARNTVPQMIDPISTTDTSFTNAYGYGTMQASGKVGDTDGYSSITDIRMIPVNDLATASQELNGFGKRFQTADAEHSLVISLSGEVFEVTGSGGVVNTELVGTDALEGSTVIHNHPIWEGYDKGDSFSEQDIIFAARNKAGMQYLISGTRRDAFIYTGSQDEYAIRRAYEKAKREVLEKAFDADMPIEFRQEAIMRVLGKYLEGFTFYEDLRF